MRSAAIVGLCVGLLAGIRPARGQDHTPSDASAALLTAYRDTLNIFAPEPHHLRPFVLPGSERVYVSGERLDTAAYRLDYRWGRLWLRDPPRSGDARLVVVYRTLRFHLQDVYRLRGVAAADTAGGLRRVVEEEEAASGFDPFEGVTLEHSGSISRGVITGSNRDLVVESGLRMQLAGEVADGVRVRAVLTDENTPIQPSGTTQRLEDFDRVFVEVQAPQGTARLGDVALDFDGSAFGQLSRQLQGATLTSRWTAPTTPVVGVAEVQVAGAVSRGIYRVQEIDSHEGVQGPYRLEGREGERFILVIAGSETVYLDGERLTRGAANDYVIDYARGEITFTPEHLITSENRIRIEFEYRTSAFTRTLLAAEGQAGLWQRPDGTTRLRLGAAFIREADDRSLVEAFDLAPADSSLLVGTGDGLATRSGAERVAFDPEAPYVQYRREIHPTAGGTVDTVFVALDVAPPDSVGVYRVRFTRVGDGEGRYVRVGQAVNGILYEYRGPGQGAYAPILRVPRPRGHRLFDLHAALEPLPGFTLFGEWAGSLNDENRLSGLDAGDDRGRAYRAGLRLDSANIGIGRLSLTYRRTFRGANFQPFVRTRPVEFDRRWNLSGLALDPTGGARAEEVGHEETDVAEMALAFSPHSHLAAEVGRLALGRGFVGWRRMVEAAAAEAGWPHLNYRLEYITSRNPFATQEGAWLRQLGAVSQPLLGGSLVPYVEVEHERRLLNIIGADSLTQPSFSFIEYRPGLDYRTERLTLGAELELRRRNEAADGRMRDASTAWTVQTYLQYHPNDNFNTKARVGLRSVEFTDYFKTNDARTGRSSVVIRSQSELRLFEGAVNVESFYEALTERTPTLQEIYLKAGPTLGQYVWQDVNGDGLVQIDEFLPERTPNEGTYVQRFVPSDSLMPVIDLETRLRVHLDPARRWRRADARWKRWLAKVEAQTILEVRERNRTDDLAQIYLLNLGRFREPGLTQNGTLHVGQTFYFFRGAPGYGLDLSFNQVRSLSDRTAGTQRRFVNAWRVEGRYRVSPGWSLRTAAAFERERLVSDRFASRTYDIRSLHLQPEVIVNFSPTMQLTAGLVFAKKRDRFGDRGARIWRTPMEMRLARAQRLQLTLRAEAARVRLQGDAAGLALYELTEGRGPGTSFAWGVNGQYAINAYLRATLAYDGRAFASEPVLHTARLSLNASF